MRKNPERLAWIVLLASLFACISLAVAVPLGIRSYILYTLVPQNVTLEVQRGPLGVTLAGRGQPVAVDDQRDDIPERSILATYATAGRLVMHVSRDESTIVATVQLYDNTQVVLVEARSPRFAASHLPHQVTLDVRTGRVRISASRDPDGRPTVVKVQTPHGVATLTEGSYEVKVNGTTMEATVRNGEAEITSQGRQVVQLDRSERAIVYSEQDGGQIVGPLPAARDLIVNGDFQAPLESGWVAYNQQDEDPPGTVSIVTNEGREVANFYRSGSNHAEVGMRQRVNYDVRDFTSLELHMVVQIVDENIVGYGGCGTLSSECPIIILIEYKDIYGTDRQWLHGFYIGEPAPDWSLYPWTEQIPQGKWHTYESGNLVEELADTPPAIIQQVTIYASGHSFQAIVTEVDLLAQE